MDYCSACETEAQLPQQVVFMRRDKSNDLFTDKQYLLTSVISLRPSEIQAYGTGSPLRRVAAAVILGFVQIFFLAFHFWGCSAFEPRKEMALKYR